MNQPKRNFRRENHRWVSTGVGKVSGTLMTYMKRKAKDRNLEFLVTAEELWNLFKSQKERCALSGVKITLSTTIDKNHNINRKEHTASLDRIDNSKGYTIDNVQWVHKVVNAMRRQYSVQEYVEWCTLVSENAKKIQEDSNLGKELWRDIL